MEGGEKRAYPGMRPGAEEDISKKVKNNKTCSLNYFDNWSHHAREIGDAGPG